MPIYEYQGQQYDIATDDVTEAKAKILGYLDKQGAKEKAQPETKAAPKASFAETPALEEMMTPAGLDEAMQIAKAQQPKGESIFERGVKMEPPTVDARKNLEAMRRSESPESVMFTPGRQLEAVETQIARGNIRQEAARQKAAEKAAQERAALEKRNEEEGYSPVDLAKDIGVGLVGKGGSAALQSVAGLGDIAYGWMPEDEKVNPLQLGQWGKMLDKLDKQFGISFDKGNEFFTGLQSPRMQLQLGNVNNADGFVSTVKELGVNPLALVDTVTSSLPSIVVAGKAGGAALRMWMTRAAEEAVERGLVGKAAEEYIRNRALTAATLAAHAAEGTLSAGAIAEQARAQGMSWSEYVAPAVAAGVGTALIGYGAGKAGAKLGIGDIETDIAARTAGMKGLGVTKGPAISGFFKEITKEGFLEEMPQSAQEQIFTNLATGRPWDEGVDKAAAQGLMAGLATAGGHNAVMTALRANASQPEVQAIKPPEQPTGEQPAQDQGAANAGQPINETGGTSPDLAAQPDQVAAPTGAGEATTDGVVPAGENVVPAGEGEGVQPAALTPTEAEPAPAKEQTVAPAQEQVAAPTAELAAQEQQAVWDELAKAQKATSRAQKAFDKLDNTVAADDPKREAALQKLDAAKEHESAVLQKAADLARQQETKQQVAAPTAEETKQQVAAPTAEETAEPAIIGFTTSKGSTYTVDADGKTSRTKLSAGKGQGETYAPHTALYVEPDAQKEILSDMQGGMGNHSVRLGYTTEDAFIPVENVADIPEGAAPTVGVFNKKDGSIVGLYDAATTPQIGLHPVEKLYTPDGMSNTHIGNRIVDIQTAQPAEEEQQPQQPQQPQPPQPQQPQGAQVGTQTPEAVQAEAQGQEAPTATAGVTPAAPAVAPPTKAAKGKGKGKKVSKRTLADKKKAVAHANKVIARSHDAETISEETSILQRLRNVDIKPLLEEASEGLDYAQRTALAYLLPTPALADVGGVNVPELKNTNTLLEHMDGMKMAMMQAGADVVSTLHRLLPDAKSQQRVSDAVLRATIARVDPRVDKSVKELNAEYRGLTKEEKEAYAVVFDYYEELANFMEQLLADEVEALGGPDAAKMLAALKEVLGAENRIRPYAPLTRDQSGKFWLRAGKDEFYTRGTKRERDRLAKAIAKERGTTVLKLKADGEIEVGDDIEVLRKRVLDSSDALRKFFALVDEADFSAGDEDAPMSQAKDGIKDSAFQLWLHMQPESSARKQFTHRAKLPPAGFSTDVIQNISVSAIKFASHAPRLKFASALRRSVSQARSSIQGRDEFTPYVSEMAKRIDDTLAPQKDSWANGFVQFSNAATFGYYMSESTAVIQLLGAYQMGMAQLVKKHSVADVAKEMGSMMAVWKSMGMENEHGEWVMPTVSESQMLKDSPTDTPEQRLRKQEDRDAVAEMHALNVAEATGARDLFGYKDVPTEQYGTKFEQGKRYARFLVGGLIHATERMSREIVFLSSFRLNRNADLAKFRESSTYKGASDKLAAERAYSEANMARWTQMAAQDTSSALFNYSESAKPRYLRNVVGKYTLQFFTYRLNTAVFLLRNLMGAIKPLPGETRKECLRAFSTLWGTTWTLSGVSGMFGVPMIVGFVSAIMRGMKDKDEPEELKDMDSMEAFKVWLYEHLGDVTIGGTSLAQIVEKGPVTAFSGIDVASRTSISDILMPPEVKETKALSDGVMEYAQWVGGADLQMILSIADGVSLFRKGEHQRGLEKIVPWATVRNKMIAFRHWTEGEESLRLGDEIMSAEMFKTGELLAEIIGLRPVLLTDVAAANRKATAMVKRVWNEREAILERIDVADRKGDIDASISTREDMDKFNAKYSSMFPDMKIGLDDLTDYLNSKNKQRSHSWAGFEFTKQNRVLADEVLDRSRTALLKREQEAQKKKAEK